MKEYKLSVDPRILELLGPNLYTNIYYVLAELIANAYDADANNVYIEANKDDIWVEDDGRGMSYEKGEIKKYLNVAGVSRTDEHNSYTVEKGRRKMGRKGVGKLAALSVSENVHVLTVSKGEKSGFVLTRHPESDNKLEPIDEGDIEFKHISNNGSAIVMKNPQYRLHKTFSVVERNLLKIFPLVDEDFRIHVIRGNNTIVLDSYDESIAKELCAMVTYGVDYKNLRDNVPVLFNNRHDDLVKSHGVVEIPITMRDRNNKEHEYMLEIEGWVGAYKSTRGRKANVSDFPDNFISLFANKKMGEFNILPVVGQNKLNEVYVVGQLHVDLFELSELPDMALSNRQGYKSDDPRYEFVRDYIRDKILPDILKKRELYADLVKEKKKKEKEELLKNNEKKLKEMVDRFRHNTGKSAAEILHKLGVDLSPDVIQNAIEKSINDNSPDLGIKSIIDDQKKKILISQTYDDKPLSDILYQMLLYNNVPAEDILYTNCDDEVCRVPEGVAVYQYLREFFVESYSSQNIYVLFVTSENTKESWGAITEVGASWITQVDHRIFNIRPFRPEHPLDDESQWQSTNRQKPKSGELSMDSLNADIFCQKIESVCGTLGYRHRSRCDNMQYIGTLVNVV